MGIEDEGSIFAPRYVAAELSQGIEIKYEKAALEKCAVASLQKLMTALVVSKLQCWEEVVEIESIDQSLLPLDRMPMMANLEAGEKFSVSELMHLMLMSSANDATMALARFITGNSNQFSLLMNEQAQSLGMNRSEFSNPHGLPFEPQHSCAFDLLKLAKAVLAEKRLAEIVKLKSWNYSRWGSPREVNNTNRLLWEIDGCSGMKTGFTLAAGNCLMTSVEAGGRSWVTVVLGSDQEHVWKDSKKLIYKLLSNSNF